MKFVLLVAFVLSVGVLADDKHGHLSQGAAVVPPVAPARLAVVPAVAPSNVAPAAADVAPANSASDADAAAAPEASEEPTFVLDLKFGSDSDSDSDSDASEQPSTESTDAVEATEATAEVEASPARPSPVPLPFPLFGLGRNPTARFLRRPPQMPALMLEAESEVPEPDAASASVDPLLPPAPPKGLFSAICGGILDALFGPPATSMPLPPPPAPTPSLVTPSGWFNLRPSSFFSSFMGPSPSEAMAADVDSAAAADASTQTTTIRNGPVLLTFTRSSSPMSMSTSITSEAESDSEEPLTVVPPSPGAELEDAGMHRVGGRSRLGKLFNRVMRFMHLRPPRWPRHHNQEMATADDDDEPTEATGDDDETEVEPDDDDEAEPSDDNAEADADADADAAVDTDGESSHGGHRWRRWRDHHRRHRGRGRWGKWHAQHRACKADARRLCGDAKREGGFMGVVNCMLEHRSELSQECTQHMSLSRAFNCAPDALALCPNVRSRRHLKRCLRKHRDSVSDACKAAIKAHHNWRAKHALSWRVNKILDDSTATTAAATPIQVLPTADSEVTFKKPTIAIELQTHPNAQAPRDSYSGAAKPVAAGPAAAPSASAGGKDWFSSRRAAFGAAVRRLPLWATILIAALGVLSLIGVVACMVMTCRRRAAAAREAAAKQPRVVVTAPARSAVQFANVTAAPAAAAAAPSQAAATKAQLSEPLLSVKVAAV